VTLCREESFERRHNRAFSQKDAVDDSSVAEALLSRDAGADGRRSLSGYDGFTGAKSLAAGVVGVTPTSLRLFRSPFLQPFLLFPHYGPLRCHTLRHVIRRPTCFRACFAEFPDEHSNIMEAVVERRRCDPNNIRTAFVHDHTGLLQALHHRI